jgi:hypothetical protein
VTSLISNIRKRPLSLKEEMAGSRRYQHGARRRRIAATLLWAAFSLGLVIDICVPHLKVRDGGFVIPAALTSGKVEVRPDQLVAREKTIQLLCCFLTVTSTLGLGACYSNALSTSTRSRYLSNR